MSDCKDNPIEDRAPPIECTVSVDAEEPTGDWRLITTVATGVARIIFGPKLVGVGSAMHY